MFDGFDHQPNNRVEVGACKVKVLRNKWLVFDRSDGDLYYIEYFANARYAFFDIPDFEVIRLSFQLKSRQCGYKVTWSPRHIGKLTNVWNG